ncbi:MAG: hypothetical protein HY320_14575 [Armatimonadetes bacterium]|nr:hypothetical protein [Armatimonadota bacterium]
MKNGTARWQLAVWAVLAVLAVVLARGEARAQQPPGSTALVIRPRGGDPQQLISFTFRQANIDDVLRFLADASGRTIFKDATVQISVTIENRSRVSVADAFQLVGALLSVRGYALVDAGDYIVITTAQDARTRRGGRVGTGAEPDKIPPGREVITQVFPLQFVDAARLREELQPLFPQGSGLLMANAQTNSLVVIDEADNVRRIADVIRALDQDISEALTVEVVPLQFADAQQLGPSLQEIFRQEDPYQGLSDEARRRIFGDRPPLPGLTQIRGQVRIAADPRRNALIVSASPANLQSIKNLLKELDVNVAPSREYRIVALKYADAMGIAGQIDTLLQTGPTSQPQQGRSFGGRSGAQPLSAPRAGEADISVVPDVRTNSVVISGPVDTIGAIEELVRSLDIPSQVQDVVRSFQLQHAVASEVAASIRQLLLGVQQQQGFGFVLFGAQRTQIPPGSPLDLLRQVTIIPHDQTNQLLVSGPAQTFALIETLIESLDKRLPQVFIEVVIADVSLDTQTKFGIEWNVLSGNSTFGTNFGLEDPSADQTGFRYSVVSRNFRLVLQALKEQDKVRILSTPHVMVTDNSPAVISIGERVPFAAASNISGGGVVQTTVDFLDVAITLNVTPHISPGDQILMDVDQVINSLLEFIPVAPGQLAPRTTSRHAGTTVTVENGQTIVIGGIISDNRSRKVQKVPILGDLPLIGNLFRNTQRQKGRSELVVFLTPHVVREPGDADQLREFERGRLQVDPLNLKLVQPLDAFPGKRRPAPAAPTP